MQLFIGGMWHIVPNCRPNIQQIRKVTGRSLVWLQILQQMHKIIQNSIWQLNDKYLTNVELSPENTEVDYVSLISLEDHVIYFIEGFR